MANFDFFVDMLEEGESVTDGGFPCLASDWLEVLDSEGDGEVVDALNKIASGKAERVDVGGGAAPAMSILRVPQCECGAPMRARLSGRFFCACGFSY